MLGGEADESLEFLKIVTSAEVKVLYFVVIM